MTSNSHQATPSLTTLMSFIWKRCVLKHNITRPFWTYALAGVVVLTQALLVGCYRVKDEKESVPLLETDDEYRPEFAKLKDVSDKINKHVTSMISAELDKIPSSTPLTPETIDQVIEATYRKLSTARPGTGFGVGSGQNRIEVSALTEIEAWLIENLDENAGEKITIKFEDSKYRNNPVGLKGLAAGELPRVPSHMTEWTANHSIAPVIKIGGVYIGIDKMGHFFEQGYWNYKTTIKEGTTQRPLTSQERFEFGQYMEGDPNLDPALHQKYGPIFKQWCARCASFGYYGTASTGVISFADINANEQGSEFYRQLEKNLTKGSRDVDRARRLISGFFDLRKFKPETMNESKVPNKYVGIKVVPCRPR